MILITDLLFSHRQICGAASVAEGGRGVRQFGFNCFAKNEIKREYVWNVGSFMLLLLLHSLSTPSSTGLPAAVVAKLNIASLFAGNEFQFLIIKVHCIFIGCPYFMNF